MCSSKQAVDQKRPWRFTDEAAEFTRSSARQAKDLLAASAATLRGAMGRASERFYYGLEDENEASQVGQFGMHAPTESSSEALEVLQLNSITRTPSSIEMGSSTPSTRIGTSSSAANLAAPQACAEAHEDIDAEHTVIPRRSRRNLSSSSVGSQGPCHMVLLVDPTPRRLGGSPTPVTTAQGYSFGV
mmetsp:Transcript_62029/g.110301  ORF Transcript_62029/g.110301 Transcript_62029/m.110301 type:complete len:187 (-) Transcript_62029:127-687(-)